LRIPETLSLSTKAMPIAERMKVTVRDHHDADQRRHAHHDLFRASVPRGHRATTGSGGGE